MLFRSGGDHHLVPLDSIQELAVKIAQHRRDGHGEQHRGHEAPGAADIEFDGQSGPQEPGDDAQRKAEVQAAARLHHRDHGQDHHPVHAESHQDVRERRVHAHPDEGRRDEEPQKEKPDDDPRPAGPIDKISDHGYPPPLLPHHQEAELLSRTRGGQHARDAPLAHDGDAIADGAQLLELRGGDV